MFSLSRDAYQLTSESWVTIERRLVCFTSIIKFGVNPRDLKHIINEEIRFFFLCARDQLLHIILYYILYSCSWTRHIRVLWLLQAIGCGRGLSRCLAAVEWKIFVLIYTIVYLKKIMCKKTLRSSRCCK